MSLKLSCVASVSPLVVYKRRGYYRGREDLVFPRRIYLLCSMVLHQLGKEYGAVAVFLKIDFREM